MPDRPDTYVAPARYVLTELHKRDPDAAGSAAEDEQEALL